MEKIVPSIEGTIFWNKKPIAINDYLNAIGVVLESNES